MTRAVRMFNRLKMVFEFKKKLTQYLESSGELSDTAITQIDQSIIPPSQEVIDTQKETKVQVKYNKLSTAPFIVVIGYNNNPKTKETELQNIKQNPLSHPIGIGIMLDKSGLESIVKMSKKEFNRVGIEFKTAKQANSML